MNDVEIDKKIDNFLKENEKDIIKIKETYNIHKNINSIFSFLKSKYLCKKGIHNYRVASTTFRDNKVKCFCCGKEAILKNDNSK